KSLIRIKSTASLAFLERDAIDLAQLLHVRNLLDLPSLEGELQRRPLAAEEHHAQRGVLGVSVDLLVLFWQGFLQRLPECLTLLASHVLLLRIYRPCALPRCHAGGHAE